MGKPRGCRFLAGLGAGCGWVMERPFSLAGLRFSFLLTGNRLKTPGKYTHNHGKTERLKKGPEDFPA